MTSWHQGSGRVAKTAGTARNRLLCGSGPSRSALAAPVLPVRQTLAEAPGETAPTVDGERPGSPGRGGARAAQVEPRALAEPDPPAEDEAHGVSPDVKLVRRGRNRPPTPVENT